MLVVLLANSASWAGWASAHARTVVNLSLALVALGLLTWLLCPRAGASLLARLRGGAVPGGSAGGLADVESGSGGAADRERLLKDGQERSDGRPGRAAGVERRVARGSSGKVSGGAASLVAAGATPPRPGQPPPDDAPRPPPQSASSSNPAASLAAMAGGALVAAWSSVRSLPGLGGGAKSGVAPSAARPVARRGAGGAPEAAGEAPPVRKAASAGARPSPARAPLTTPPPVPGPEGAATRADGAYAGRARTSAQPTPPQVSAGASASASAPPSGGDASPAAIAAAELLELPDSTGKYNVKLKRQFSAKQKESQIYEALERQQRERHNQRRKAEEDEARVRRVLRYEATLSTLWESQWAHVQLTRLPTDNDRPDANGCKGVAEREPELESSLAELLKEYFQQLFDVYLYYAKVDADEAAAELYRMTDFNWKALLKDATMCGADAKSQLTTQSVTRIFKTVNQRRDNLTQNKGAAGGGGAAEADTMTPGAITDAALQAMVAAGAAKAAEAAGAAATGFSATVTKSHFAAGSLYAFTFSEFLEGLVHAALELPPTAGLERPPEGLSSSYVLRAVRAAVEQRVLRYAKKGEVLQFRRAIIDSPVLTEALDVLRPQLDPLYDRYAERPANLKQGDGISLRSFLEVCQEGGVVGSQLSHVQMKNAFVHSLQITAETQASRKPLLERGEFYEAILRIVHKYDASHETSALPGIGPAKGARAARKAAEAAKSPINAAGQLGQKMLHKLTPRKAPSKVSDGPGSAEAAGTLALPTAATPAVGTPRNEMSEFESTIMDKLPLVCGKLLAVLEVYTRQAAGAAVS